MATRLTANFLKYGREIDSTTQNPTIQENVTPDKDGYYFVDSVIEMDTEDVPVSNFITKKFPSNSTIEFREGGRISCATNVILFLAKSQIVASSRWIFGKNVYIFECGNSQIQSEWFNDPSLIAVSGTDQLHINKAIACAASSTDENELEKDFYGNNFNGSAPEVVLRNRIYNLSAPIEFRGDYFFPSNSFQFTTRQSGQRQRSVHLQKYALQRFISPGCISASESYYATNINAALIRIKCPSIDLNVDRLKGIKISNSSTGNLFGGTGIELSGYTENSSIVVRQALSLRKGIAVVYNPIAGDDSNYKCAVQYTRFIFQVIDADYGFYFDLYDSSGEEVTSYFNENLILGGRLIGRYGIYVNDAQLSLSELTWKFDGNVFANIGFEGLTAIPLYLRGMHACEFTCLRMMENLPGLTNNSSFDSDAVWVDMKKVSTINLGIKGSIVPNHFKAVHCSHVIVNSWITDMDDASRFHFDRMAFLPIYPDGKYSPTTFKVMTSSLQPYNMERYVYPTDGSADPKNKTSFLSMEQLMPLNDTLYLNHLKLTDSSDMTITQLSGLSEKRINSQQSNGVRQEKILRKADSTILIKVCWNFLLLKKYIKKYQKKRALMPQMNT